MIPLFKGHLHSGDIKFGPGKATSSSKSLLKGQLYSGKKGTFSGSETQV